MTSWRNELNFFKESKEGIAIMCKVMEDVRNESLKEGIKEGKRKSMRAGAERRMPGSTYSITAATITGSG